MNPQERDLLGNLADRLRQSPPQQRDAEADAMIGDLVREKPDTPYILAQTVLIQDYALHQAQARIAELESQFQARPQESGGFLSAIFGSGKPPQPQPRTQPQPQAPAYQPPPQPVAAGPWGPAPAQQVFAQPSFLRSAATTAAGIAGGALLFQGIESLLGGRGGYGGFGGIGYGGGFMPQPGLTETTINNYNQDPSRDVQQADSQQGNFDTGNDPGQGATDANFDTGGDFSGGDSGGGDFGGSDV